MDETDYHAPKGDAYNQQWKALSAWFLGPRAENRDVFLKIFTELLDEHSNGRQSYFPTDPPYITNEMRASDEFAAEIEEMRTKLFAVSNKLKESVPFYSPRYQAHMMWDVTMPSLLAYMMAVLQNQNGGDTAASSVTTPIEKAVGLQLCDMLGYNINEKSDEPKGWGHITCGGSVANIEAMWAARNIKFSAIGLQYAVQHSTDNTPIVLTETEKAMALDYKIKVGVKKDDEDYYEWKEQALGECSIFQLLNMDVDEYCNLTNKVAKAIGLKGEVLDRFGAWVEENSYTSLGAQRFMELHSIKPVKCTVTATCHYSWPKAATLLGMGSDALIKIPVDDLFRQDVAALEQQLIDCAEKQIPITSVMVVIGSTEESSVDPILPIWDLRNIMKTKYGINFSILADSAWGGYLKTMTIGTPKKDRPTYQHDFVPFIPLTDYVTEQYNNIHKADTITIDPHKSGFCPYPAGALCYRNGDMRYFIAIMHPEVYHGDDDPTMSVYGIEGSKPGASPTAVYTSHQVIGLDVFGYGRILGQCTTTAKIFYCLWHTLARPNDPFVCVPLQKLPEEYRKPYDVNDVTGITLGEHLIKTRIMGKSMSEIYADQEAMDLLKKCGPDTLINTFVINPKNADGTVNTDIKRSNELQKTLSNSLNVLVGIDAHRVPLIIMQSGLNKDHGRALTNFKERIGLELTNTDLNVMVNTTMNPWQWSESIALLGDIFRCQILNCIGRMDDEKYQHEFILSGDVNDKDEIFAEYVPDFNVTACQYHLVVKLQLRSVRGTTIKQGWRVKSGTKINLHEFLTCKEQVYFDLYDGDTPKGHVYLQVVDIPRFQHFDMSEYAAYHKNQTYFLYGDEGRTYISHCMKKSPDFMQMMELTAPPYGLSSDLVNLGVDLTIEELEGEPKVVDGEIVDPLENQNYTVKYRGRQFAMCKSTVYLKELNTVPPSCSVFFKHL